MGSAVSGAEKKYIFYRNYEIEKGPPIIKGSKKIAKKRGSKLNRPERRAKRVFP